MAAIDFSEQSCTVLKAALYSGTTVWSQQLCCCSKLQRSETSRGQRGEHDSQTATTRTSRRETGRIVLFCNGLAWLGWLMP
jgi:hypothetical protein